MISKLLAALFIYIILMFTFAWTMHVNKNDNSEEAENTRKQMEVFMLITTILMLFAYIMLI